MKRAVLPVIACAIIACSEDGRSEQQEAPTAETPPIEVPAPIPELPNYTGHVWCAVAMIAGRRNVVDCAESQVACADRAARNHPGANCERLSSAAARNVYRQFSAGEPWEGPSLELYENMGRCLGVASVDREALGLGPQVASACVAVNDEAYAQEQARALETEMRDRAESTRNQIWCYSLAGGGASNVWCHEGRRSCEDLRQRLGPDRGIEASPCERRPEAFGYSYRSRIYGYQMRALRGTPGECAATLEGTRDDNRRGLGRASHLSECYVLRSTAR